MLCVAWCSRHAREAGNSSKIFDERAPRSGARSRIDGISSLGIQIS